MASDPARAVIAAWEAYDVDDVATLHAMDAAVCALRDHLAATDPRTSDTPPDVPSAIGTDAAVEASMRSEAAAWRDEPVPPGPSVTMTRAEFGQLMASAAPHVQQSKAAEGARDVPEWRMSVDDEGDPVLHCPHCGHLIGVSMLGGPQPLSMWLRGVERHMRDRHAPLATIQQSKANCSIGAPAPCVSCGKPTTFKRDVGAQCASCAVAAERDALRARLAEVEGREKRMQEREAHFARVLGVADGGQYRADWNAAIERVVAERDAAIARAEAAEQSRDAIVVDCNREEARALKAEQERDAARADAIADIARAALAATEAAPAQAPVPAPASDVLREALEEALVELEETRWNSDGGIREWADSTADGRNFSRVSTAMRVIRAALDTRAPDAAPVRIASERDIDTVIAAMRALEPPLLTFAAEKLGYFVGELLEHWRAVVREGAVIGAEGIGERVRCMVESDPSDAVRRVARTVLAGAAPVRTAEAAEADVVAFLIALSGYAMKRAERAERATDDIEAGFLRREATALTEAAARIQSNVEHIGAAARAKGER